jgi:hypothetical protein
VRLQDLDEALRKFVAWESILRDSEQLNLDPHQKRQAETQRDAANDAVTARLPETYQWLLVPEQARPQDQATWQAIRLTGTDALAVRASRKLRNDDLLVTSLGSTVLRKHLDDVPLWRGDHVQIRQLVEDFARYTYLPRLRGPEVLAQALRDGIALLTWQSDTFAYAESYDDKASWFRGLRGGQTTALTAEDSGLLVKSDVASKQLGAEGPFPPPLEPPRTPTTSGAEAGSGGGRKAVQPPAVRATRFHGTVELDPTRVGRDASRIADEVIAHLAGLMGAQLKVTLEIEAGLPRGVPDAVVRTVTENSRTLKFESHGFETD